jgi:hypothetical protein
LDCYEESAKVLLVLVHGLPARELKEQQARPCRVFLPAAVQSEADDLARPGLASGMNDGLIALTQKSARC